MPVGKFIAIGLPIALGVVMIGAGAVNFVGPKSVRDSFVRWGYPAGFHRVTGGLETIAAIGGQSPFNGADACLSAFCYLAPDINLAGGIIADEHYRKSRIDAARLQTRDRFNSLAGERAGHGAPVDHCAHTVSLRTRRYARRS